MMIIIGFLETLSSPQRHGAVPLQLLQWPHGETATGGDLASTSIHACLACVTRLVRPAQATCWVDRNAHLPNDRALVVLGTEMPLVRAFSDPFLREKVLAIMFATSLVQVCDSAPETRSLPKRTISSKCQNVQGPSPALCKYNQPRK